MMSPKTLVQPTLKRGVASAETDEGRYGAASEPGEAARRVQTIAVLALQGAFAEHERMLERLGQHVIELRQASDLDQPFERLVLPGGESTVQTKLLREEGMLEPLRARIEAGMPVLATCAGLILLAERVEGGEPCFGTLDATVRRNAYGRQLGSFHADGAFAGIPGDKVPMSFIRAPYVAEVGPRAQALAEVDGHVVAVRQGKQLAMAFHPELDDDLQIHRLFCKL